ncbi:ScyD/ScyE family protein [Streptomyces sp. NPDC005329]|uniref:ScyD/ScyE family protein n=1 Tax=Streptomyces sp. NPDC005329 TaxID=3157034 RepID=UPI00339EBD52
MSRASKSWAGAFVAAAVVGSLTATVMPSQAAPRAASGAGASPVASVPVVVASGLHNPRAVRVQADGALLVTEAGSDPAVPCTVPGSQCLSFSGSIYRIKGSVRGRVVTGLPSMQIVRADGSSVISGAIEAEAAAGGAYRVVSGVTGTPTTRTALGAGSGPLGTLSIAHGRVLGDLAVHEVEHDPDSAVGNNEVFSNPWNFARDGRDFLVTDAGANDLVRVHPDGTTSTELAFPNNVVPAAAASGDASLAPAGQAEAVPTGIVRGWDGAFYIADMSGIRTGLSRIWRYVPGGQPTVFASGLTGLIDLAVAPGGDLIALSYTGGATSSGLLPGSLIRIGKKTGAATVIDTGGSLNTPTGLAVSSKGDIYVTSNTQGSSGELLKFSAS